MSGPITSRAAAVLAFVALSQSARAEPWVFEYDEFPEALSAAAAQVDGGQFYTQPGFVRGESFGQIYRPLPEMFPLQILGFDLILAAPPFASGTLFTNATIEVYNSESKTPDPGNAPIFSISTGDLFNPATQEIGFPLQGNVGLSIQFDLSEEDNRPPMLTGGNIWVMVRFDDEAMSLSSEWNSLQCLQIDGLICGCQNVGTVHDSGIVKNANVIHHMAPLGACSGPSMGWTYMEDAPSTNSGFTIDGDIIMRLRAEVAAAPCEPACDDLACGDDGCGGSCGTCSPSTFCVDGGCVSCQPDCLSKQCGDNGCGGSCGTCGNTQTCGNDFFCHDDCAPQCSGKDCGPDGCGSTCGSCESGLACTAGTCRAACAPACDNKDCGPDGCGGACGTCDGGLSCIGGQCQAPCEPACGDKQCGADGCGGTCGSCDSGETCASGQCEGAAPALMVTNVSPNSGLARVPTPISITGKGFMAGAQVKVGATDCTDEIVTGDGLISATVPGLTVGQYSVIVVNPDDAVATLPNAFQVNPLDLVDPTPGNSDGGCATGGSETLLAGLAGLAIVTLATRLRTRVPRQEE